MSLYNKVKTQLNYAVRSQNVAARTVLKTLVGELETHAKRGNVNVSDSMVVKRVNSPVTSLRSDHGVFSVSFDKGE